MSSLYTLWVKEVKSYFLSPIAYLFITVYIVLTNFIFFQTFFIENVASMRSYFSMTPWLFLVFIPAITMRSWSEERKNHTLELLLTWPVRDVEIIASKFLASCFLLAFTLLLSGTVPLTVISLGNTDIGVIAGSYLGAFLMGASYIAIGLWVSSITVNQIVAFIATTLIIASFLMVGSGIVTEFLPSSMVPFFQQLGITTHFESIARGVIDSRDLVYYLSLILFFLFLNGQSLESRKWD